MAITDLAPQRLAIASDTESITTLMKRSVADLFPRFYDPRQTATAITHVASLDTVLIEDATYYVHEAGGEIVACGGWSRRNRLHAGSGESADDDRLLDPRTEPARVRAMFVRGDWARRGLGRAILESCERAARAEGFTMLALMATLPGEPLYRVRLRGDRPRDGPRTRWRRARGRDDAATGHTDLNHGVRAPVPPRTSSR